MKCYSFVLLTRIVRSLTPEEVHSLRSQLVLPGRSQKIFDLISRSDAHSQPSAEALRDRFSLTPTNLHRLLSEISDACIRILQPDEQYPKLEFFARKVMYSEYVAELKRIERSLTSSDDHRTKEYFYQRAYLLLSGFPLMSIDLDLQEQLALKWHKWTLDPPVDDLLEKRLRVALMKIAALPTRKKMTVAKMRSTARAILDPFIREVAATTNPAARYYYYQCEWKACNYEPAIGEERVQWLERCVEIVRQHQSFFSPGVLEQMRLTRAYERALFCNEARSSFAEFHELASMEPPTTTAAWLKRMWYIRVAIIAKEFATAKALIETTVKTTGVTSNPGLWAGFLAPITILHLLDNDLPSAEKTIESYKNINSGEFFFLPREVEIRALETVLALRSGDLASTDVLVRRNSRWMLKRRYGLGQGPWPYFFQIIGEIVTFRLVRKRPKPSTKKHFQTFSRVSPEFAMLLEDDMKAMTGQKV